MKPFYLHYVLDEWFETVVKPRLKGEAYEVRFADDFILCFQYREDAEKVLEVLKKRFQKYGLTIHPEKTRLMEFGRGALAKSEKPGGGRSPQLLIFSESRIFVSEAGKASFRFMSGRCESG